MDFFPQPPTSSPHIAMNDSSYFSTPILSYSPTLTPPTILPRTPSDRLTTYLLYTAILLSLSIPLSHVVLPKRTHTNSPARPIWYAHLDPVLGLDVLYVLGRAVTQHRLLTVTRAIISAYPRTLSWLCFGKQAVLTIDPENIKAMLSTRFSEFGLGRTRKEGLEPLFGKGVFNSDGEVWKGHRSVLRPFLSRVRDAELQTFETHVQAFLRHVPQDGSTFDMQQLFASLTLDVSTEVFFGASTHLLSSKQAERTEGQEFAEAFDYAQRTLVGTEDYNVFKLLGKLFFGDRKLRLSLHVIEKFVDKILDRALLERDLRAEQDVPAEARSLPDALLGVGRSRKDIKDDIINLVLAGKDATAAVLSSTWYLLSQHPDVYGKLRDEISVLEGRPPAKEDLPRFSYLQMVLQEVLRLFPPVALNQRTAEVDTILPHGGGSDGQSPIFVQRGASVGYSVYAMHRIPEFFGPEVDEFRPERWREIRPQWAYMPFHAGPRTCLGKQFALALVKYCTIRLIQECPRPEDRNTEPWQEKLGLICSSRHGVQIAF